MVLLILHLWMALSRDRMEFLHWIRSETAENINIQFKVLDTFSSNDKGLNTGGYDQTGTQIFYQTTTYHRYGPILELNLTYTLNTSLQKKKSPDSTFGESEF